MKKISKDPTFLGKGTEFEGKLTFHGTLRIDGHFKGEIEAEGNLIVSESAKIEANIKTSYILITGEVHGDILADQRVDIRAPARVYANIQAPSVVMGEGALFWGETHMQQLKEEDEKKSALIGSDKYASGPPPNVAAIYGIVTDQKTGKPINQAKVTCRGTEKRNIETNTSGYYELTDLEDGVWKLKIKAKYYSKGKAKVRISGRETHEQNFVLMPKKNEPL